MCKKKIKPIKLRSAMLHYTARGTGLNLQHTISRLEATKLKQNEDTLCNISNVTTEKKTQINKTAVQSKADQMRTFVHVFQSSPHMMGWGWKHYGDAEWEMGMTYNTMSLFMSNVFSFSKFL